MNSRSSMPIVQPKGSKTNLVASETSDGDFGANDSRSEYSAKIPEDIAGSASDEKPKEILTMQEPKSGTNVEDSINDRDLESSVARQAFVVTAPPLTKVPEVEETKEVTLDTKEELVLKQPEVLPSQSMQLDVTDG